MKLTILELLNQEHAKKKKETSYSIIMKEYIEREVLLKKDAFKNSKYCMES
jgi:hypothetical protein